MKRRGVLLMLVAALVLWSFGGTREAKGQTVDGFTSHGDHVWKAHPLGVSPFLLSSWVGAQGSNQNKNKTTITLQNPTPEFQTALIFYYDTEENFLQCEVKRLSPHDVEFFNSPKTDFFGSSMAFPKSGPIEVVTTGGANQELGFYYIPEYPITSGSWARDYFAVENATVGLVGEVTQGNRPPLAFYLVDFAYFNFPAAEDPAKACACVALCKLAKNNTYVSESDFDFLNHQLADTGGNAISSYCEPHPSCKFID